jgi:hypothetical protein
MKRTAVSLTAIALAGLSLTACGDTKTDGSASQLTLPPTTSATQSSTSASMSPAKNSRGNLVKALGQEAGISGEDGSTTITFAVDSITPDPQCDSDYHSDPENGHLVQVQMRLTTSAGVDPSSYDTVGSNDFKFIGSDGTTKSDLGTMAAFDCFESDKGMMTQDALGPGQAYSGYILVDVPEAAGTLIFQPSWGQQGGWEYTF